MLYLLACNALGENVENRERKLVKEEATTAFRDDTSEPLHLAFFPLTIKFDFLVVGLDEDDDVASEVDHVSAAGN